MTPITEHVTENLPQTLDSDRDSLPFPTGGVFGSAPGRSSDGPNADGPAGVAPTIEQQLERVIARMQFSLDELERELGNELARELDALKERIDAALQRAAPSPPAPPPNAA